MNDRHPGYLATGFWGNFGKRHHLTVIVVVMLIGITNPVSYCCAAEAKQSQNSQGNEIAVFDFNDIHGKPQQGLGSLVADLLSETLTKSKNVKVRSRNKLILDLHKNNFHFLIPPDGIDAIEAAQALKLRYVVTGKVLNYEIISEEAKKWFGSRAVDFFISMEYSLFDVASRELLVSERIDDIVNKRVVSMPELENTESNRPFMESLFFPVAARIAIKINGVFEQ